MRVCLPLIFLIEGNGSKVVGNVVLHLAGAY